MSEPVSAPGAGRGSATDSLTAQQAGNSNGRRPASSNGTGRFAGRMFVAATGQLDNGTPVVRVIGELDLATVPALEQAFLGVGDDPAAEVIVDLTGCTFLDSCGLRALLAARERLERSNRRLALALCAPAVARVFQITGLGELFEIYPSVGAASTAMATTMASRAETN
jgi:anti-sigma B factor antagonist